MRTRYRPELLYAGGDFLEDAELVVDESGSVANPVPANDEGVDAVVELRGKALLPGFVNAHSHAFQRLIRGKSESRAAGGRDFWSWRGCMYHAAAALRPREVYDVARMVFLEMALAGTTTVGEFHYLHTQADGQPYEDPNLLAKQVIAAAQSIGIRIVLLRTAYFRAGYGLPPDAGQRRFIEDTRSFLANMQELMDAYAATESGVRFGVAPHSIRAVPLGDLRAIAAWGKERRLPVHMHVAEQVAENSACVAEYGTTPVALLAREGLLSPGFTAVHSIHMDAREMGELAAAEATICSCPTTERNLGDGIVAADAAMRRGVRFALGSDSQAQIAPLEDARQLEYHLRLEKQQRAVLDLIDGKPLAARLFECATMNGARALDVRAGELKGGEWADFFTVDLDDVSIHGHTREDLLSTVVFSLERPAIRDVAVQGKFIVRDGKHALRDEVLEGYREVHDRVWRDAGSGAGKSAERRGL